MMDHTMRFLLVLIWATSIIAGIEALRGRNGPLRRWTLIAATAGLAIGTVLLIINEPISGTLFALFVVAIFAWPDNKVRRFFGQDGENGETGEQP